MTSSPPQRKLAQRRRPPRAILPLGLAERTLAPDDPARVAGHVSSAEEAALLGARVDLADGAGAGRADDRGEVGEAHGSFVVVGPFFFGSFCMLLGWFSVAVFV